MAENDQTDKREAQTQAATDEPVDLTPEVLEQLLTGCYWDILKRMRQVALKELTVDQAADLDDAIARHLARTLMGENLHFRMRLPYQAMPLVDMVRAKEPKLFAPDALAGVDQANPRAMMIYLCREFVKECYFAITAVGSRENFTAEMVRDEGLALCALWCRRLCQPGTEQGLN